MGQNAQTSGQSHIWGVSEQTDCTGCNRIVAGKEDQKGTVGSHVKVNHHMLMWTEMKSAYGQFLTLLSLGHRLSFCDYGHTMKFQTTSHHHYIVPHLFSHAFFLTTSLKRDPSSVLAVLISCWPQLLSVEISFILSCTFSALSVRIGPV